MDLYVLKSDVDHSDSGLSSTCATFIERIEHAARSITIRFFHLLGTNIDSPPNRPIHCEIRVVNILDESCAFISWISFNIDSFERSHHSYISKCDILDTITLFFRGHTAYSHSNSQKHSTIFNQEVSGAISNTFWFGYNDIIIILASNVIDMESCSRRIDAISIEREHYEWALEWKSFDEIYLGCCVYLYIDIEELAVVALIHF